MIVWLQAGKVTCPRKNDFKKMECGLGYFSELKKAGLKKRSSAGGGICFFIWKFVSFPVPVFS